MVRLLDSQKVANLLAEEETVQHYGDMLAALPLCGWQSGPLCLLVGAYMIEIPDGACHNAWLAACKEFVTPGAYDVSPLAYREVVPVGDNILPSCMALQGFPLCLPTRRLSRGLGSEGSRQEQEVLKEHLESHLTAHSSEILPWLFIGGGCRGEMALQFGREGWGWGWGRWVVVLNAGLLL